MVVFLEALVDVQSSLHVCFASRHYPHITVQRSHEIILEERDGHEKDIASYLSSALRITPEVLAEQIRSEMQAKAHGVFMWVVLVVDILNKEFDSGRKYKLQERLQQLPGDLHLLFRDILTRDTNNREGLLLCIQWVLFAKEPLTPRQLHLAILSGTEPEFLTHCHSEPYLEEDVQRYILDNSKGLAQSTKSKKSTVQFIHESVRDFLLKGNGLGELFSGPESNIRGKSHEALKNCCLTYMTMESIMKLESSSSSEAIQAFPFLDYAHHGVLFHGNEAALHGIRQDSFIADFPRSEWVKQHNILEKSQVRQYTTTVTLLYILAEAGLPDLIRAHSKRQSCFDFESERYGVPILAALALKHESTVQVMLELQAERIPGFDFADFCERLKSVETKSQSPGRAFKFRQKRKVVDQLLEHGDERILLFFLETTDYDSWSQGVNSGSLFSSACEDGKLELARHMAQFCSLTSNVGNGETPLHCASKHGAVEAAKILVGRGADSNAKDWSGSTPLHCAAKSDRLESAKLLIDRGADISAADLHGDTPLHYVASKGHLQTAKLLIEGGADISAANFQGDTPLHFVARKGHLQTAQLLLDHGASVSTSNNSGKTPLHDACNHGNPEMIRLLMDHGADIFAKTENGSTPLLHASNQTIIALFLYLGAENYTMNSKETLLHYACSQARTEVARQLLERGADVSATNTNGETPLHKACQGNLEHESIKIVEMLIKNTADPSAATNNGETPLHQLLLNSRPSSSAGNRLEIAKILVNSGAEISYPDNIGRTPLQLALSNVDGQDIADFLQSCVPESSSPVARPAARHEVKGQPLLSMATIDSTEDSNQTFGEELAAKLCHELISTSTDKRDIVRLLGSLPRLLQTFAMKIAKENRDKDSREVMRLIFKYPEYITDQFKMKAQEIVLRKAEQSDRDPGKQTIPSPAMHYADKVQNWNPEIHGIHDPNMPVDSNNVEDKSFNNEEHHDDDNEEEGKQGGEDNPGDNLLQLVEDRISRSVHRSQAYRWLLARLKNELQFVVPTESAIPRLSEAILGKLNENHHFSRKSAPERIEVIFDADWSPHSFFETQEYGVSPEEALVKALVLVGTTKQAEGLACGDYLLRQWPETAPSFLRIVQSVVMQSDVKSAEVTSLTEERLDDEITLRASIKNGRFELEAYGHPDSVIEIGEQLLWISCALRSSDYEGVGTCTPRIGELLIRGSGEDPLADRSSSWTSMRVELAVTPRLDELDESESGACWKALFRNPLIVEGYPIPLRADSQIVDAEPTFGLQLSLSALMTLVTDSRLVSFMGKLFIKRFSTLLVAVRQIGNVILWHSISNDDGSYIHYHDKRVERLNIKVNSSLLKEADLSEKKHVVGWTTSAHNIAGTSESVLQIETSTLPPKQVPAIELEKVTIGFSKYITLNASLLIGLRDKPLNAPQGGDYRHNISLMSRKFVVLYDVSKERGFLVDGATALLHLVQYALHQYYEDGSPDVERNSIKLDENPDLRLRSLRTLLSSENTRMKLHPNLDEENIQTQTKEISEHSDPTATTNENTSSRKITREVTSSANESWQHLKDKVINIFWMLSPAFDMACDETFSLELKGVRGLGKLKGYEFWKVATYDTAGLLFTKAGSSSRAWLGLVRRIGAPTLFGCGFGDIIRHENRSDSYMCLDWMSVPENKGYLAISNSTLRDVMRYHRSEEILQTISEVCGKSPRDPFESCNEKHGTQKCDRRHFLINGQKKTRLNSDLNLPDRGAVIIGHESKSKESQGKASGPPQESNERPKKLFSSLRGRNTNRPSAKTSSAPSSSGATQQPPLSYRSTDMSSTTPLSTGANNSITGNASSETTVHTQDNHAEIFSAIRPQQSSEISVSPNATDFEPSTVSGLNFRPKTSARLEPGELVAPDISIAANESQMDYLMTSPILPRQSQVGVGIAGTTIAADCLSSVDQVNQDAEGTQMSSRAPKSLKRKAIDAMSSLARRTKGE